MILYEFEFVFVFDIFIQKKILFIFSYEKRRCSNKFEEIYIGGGLSILLEIWKNNNR